MLYLLSKAYEKRHGEDIVRALHVPLAVQIAEEVKSSYVNPLPGLPYPEVPVIALSGMYHAIGVHKGHFLTARS